MEAVLNNPLLLKNILEYALIENNSDFLSNSNVASLRLVSNQWLQSASRVIKESKRSVIHITLGNSVSTTNLNKREYGKSSKLLMYNFMATFCSKSHSKHSFLTIQLNFDHDFFIIVNFKVLQNFLRYCGQYVVDVQIRIPPHEELIKKEFKKLDFALLRSVRVVICGYLDDDSTTENSNRTSLKLLDLFFKGAENLKDFDYCEDGSAVVFFRDIGSLTLPTTITRFSLRSFLRKIDYELLMNSSLPNLTLLELDLLRSIPHQHIFNLLNRFRTSLKRVEIVLNDEIEDFPRLPLMENLEWLGISGAEFEFTGGVRVLNPDCFPKLNNFTLRHQTESSYLSWIANLRFGSVKELFVGIKNENQSKSNSGCFQTPSLMFLRELQNSFPNTTKMTFGLNFDNMNVLKTLFRDWTQLKELDLIFVGKHTPKLTQCLMISVFLGIELDIVKGSKFEEVNIQNRMSQAFELNCDETESIINLTELTFLTLTSDFKSGNFKWFLEVLPLAFNKMPNLKRKTFMEIMRQ